jgi:hypothetical protein
MMGRGRALSLLMGAVLLLCGQQGGRAEGWSYFEGFDEGLTRSWEAFPGALPDESLAPFDSHTVVYGGPPPLSFGGVGDADVAVLHVSRSPSFCRFGMVTRDRLKGSEGMVEARVNTLYQGGLYIDGLFDLWLVNSQDSRRFVRVGLFGDNWATRPSWTYSSSFGFYSQAGPDALPWFPFQSATWYRVRVIQRPKENVEVSIWNDRGTRRLVSHTFPFSLSLLGNSFRIGISQWMGGPNGTHSMLCAVDRIEATPVALAYSEEPGFEEPELEE